MKLSIIVPSHNMAPKASTCLLSILESSADKKDYEVIVCDSSDDSTMDVLKALCLKYTNLKVMHVKHKLPAGSARNIAWQKCAGEYVMCIDIDDQLASQDTLQKVISGLDGKDIYACSYISRRDSHEFILKPSTIGQMANIPVACWTKIVKRELWVQLPAYMPEDVWTHFMLIDKCKTFGYFDFAIVNYDNTAENKGAMSRTFDWLLENPSNLAELAMSGKLKSLGLKEEYVAGVIHNLADMWAHKDDIQQPEVKKAYMRRFLNEYKNFMAGIYVH